MRQSTKLKVGIFTSTLVAAIAGCAIMSASAVADEGQSEPPGPALQVVDKLCVNGLVIAVSRPGIYAIRINHEAVCGPSI